MALSVTGATVHRSSYLPTYFQVLAHQEGFPRASVVRLFPTAEMLHCRWTLQTQCGHVLHFDLDDHPSDAALEKACRSLRVRLKMLRAAGLDAHSRTS